MLLIPEIDSCFCLSLEKASTTIGYFELIFFGVLYIGTNVYNVAKELKDTESIPISLTVIISNQYAIAIFLTASIFGGYLLLGIKNRKRELITSWILLNSVSIFVMTTTLIFYLTPLNHRPAPGITIISLAIFSVLGCFFQLVVVNYYRSISRGNIDNDI